MIINIVLMALEDRDAEGLRIGLSDHLNDADCEYLRTHMKCDEETLQQFRDVYENNDPAERAQLQEYYGDINGMIGEGNPESNWEGAALHAAVATGRMDLVQPIIDAGANVNIQVVKMDEPTPGIMPSVAPLQTRAGDTPLHIAASKNMEHVAPNPQDQYYNPGFFKVPGAEHRGGPDLEEYPQIVRALLNAGADPNITNSEGRTPREIAVQFNNQDLVAIFDEVVTLALDR